MPIPWGIVFLAAFGIHFFLGLGRPIWALPKIHDSQIEHIVSTGRDRFFLTADNDGIVKIWNSSNRTLAGEMNFKVGSLRSLDLSDTEDLVLAVGAKGEVLLWPLSAGQPTRLQEDGAATAMFVPDKRRFLIRGEGGEITFWSRSPATPHYRIEELFKPDSAIAFTIDGDHLAAETGEGEIGIWKVRGLPAPARVATLTWPQESGKAESPLGRIRKLDFSEGNRYLSALSGDGVICVWEFGFNHGYTLRPIRRLEVPHPVLDSMFCKDEDMIIALAPEGYVTFWQTNTGAYLYGLYLERKWLGTGVDLPLPQEPKACQEYLRRKGVIANLSPYSQVAFMGHGRGLDIVSVGGAD